MENKENILFIRLRLLGDIVFTIPSVQIYKKHFPDSLIYYVVEEKFKEIAMLIPGIHKVIVIPRKMSLSQMWGFRKEIKRLGLNRVIDLHSGPKSAQLTLLSGAKLRIGYKTPNRNIAYNRLTPRSFTDGYTHSVYNQAKLLEHLGIPVREEDIPPYPVIELDESLINDTVRTLPVSYANDKKVVIHIGAGNAFREWGNDKFSGLIERLKQAGVKIFLIGNGAAEMEKGAYFAQRFNIHDLTGKLSISDLLWLISRSSVYFGADSGPLHLASLTSTPIVALYGPNLPEISGPWRKHKVTILQKEMECRPCDQRKCIYDIIPCMKTITTDEVYDEINRYFQ